MANGSDLEQQLAQAAAAIGDLRRQLAEATGRASDAERLRVALDAAQRDTQTARSTLIPMQARVAELERLLAPPQPGSGLVRVQYDDGRVKWAAPDGGKFVLPADGLRHMRIMEWVESGLMTETQAKASVDRGIFLASQRAPPP
jgi:hypothetical protein